MGSRALEGQKVEAKRAQIETAAVLAGAYRGKAERLMLTHSIDRSLGGEVALCGQPNIVDTHAARERESEMPPTCPRCAKKDPRCVGLLDGRVVQS